MTSLLPGCTVKKPIATTCVVQAAMAVICALQLFSAQAARAHPHVTVEANLEIIRNTEGAVTELRHVWRFDELFSSTVLLDYDTNANGALESEELLAVSDTVTQSVGEQDYFTEVRLGTQTVEFSAPQKILVDYVDGQVLMFFALGFSKPVAMTSGPLKVSVSDPTYYVGMEIADETAVQVTGAGAACGVEIARPDFDKLMSQNPAAMTEQFFNDPKNDGLGDEWLTWITLTCK